MKKKIILLSLIITSIISFAVFEFKMELYATFKFYFNKRTEFKVTKKNLDNFLISNSEEYKLINSAIKEDYNIYFKGNIMNFDTLFIGKGVQKYFSSYIEINRDSIVLYKVTKGKQTKSYKHNLSLKNEISIAIERKLNLAKITIINEEDTLKIDSDFVGMNNPFIRSSGSNIKADIFNFTHDNYYSNTYIFGDSYVSCNNPKRWPYHVYNKGYKFLCDGLPGGNSVDSFDYLNSALSVHKPKYLVWCLGMNDHKNRFGLNLSWKHYLKKVMNLFDSNNITLVLATIPSVPTLDNTLKNKFIRESGYRYIDFDKAVSNSNGIWKKGMLSSDGIHPTELGAKMMAKEFFKEFLEIKEN